MRLCAKMLFTLAVLGLLAQPAAHAAEKLGLKKGDVQLKSSGPLAFGPDGILFIGDPKAAVIYAVDTGETAKPKPFAEVKVENLDKQAAEVAGAEAKVVDLAVNPQTGSVFLSVNAGDKPSILKVTSSGKLEALELKGIPTSKAALANPPEDKLQGEGRRQRNPRNDSITDMAYVDGQLLVSGLRAVDAPSSVEAFPFPFGKSTTATSLEIYHAAHNRVEDNAVVRVFVPFNINGEPSLLAGFTCTPLVRFPIDKLTGGEKVRGTTVAELGNRNQPLDMIAYEKDGKVFLLSANSARGVMKISTDDIENNPGLTEAVPDGNTAGQSFEKIEELQGVVQLDKLDDFRAVIVQQNDSGVTLRTIDLP